MEFIDTIQLGAMGLLGFIIYSVTTKIAPAIKDFSDSHKETTDNLTAAVTEQTQYIRNKNGSIEKFMERQEKKMNKILEKK